MKPCSTWAAEGLARPLAAAQHRMRQQRNSHRHANHHLCDPTRHQNLCSLSDKHLSIARYPVALCRFECKKEHGRESKKSQRGHDEDQRTAMYRQVNTLSLICNSWVEVTEPKKKADHGFQETVGKDRIRHRSDLISAHTVISNVTREDQRAGTNH